MVGPLTFKSPYCIPYAFMTIYPVRFLWSFCYFVHFVECWQRDSSEC